MSAQDTLTFLKGIPGEEANIKLTESAIFTEKCMACGQCSPSALHFFAKIVDQQQSLFGQLAGKLNTGARRLSD